GNSTAIPTSKVSSWRKPIFSAPTARPNKVAIHPQAIVDPGARIASDVEIGPFSVIGPDVEIGAGTCVASHVVIKGPTQIGRHNQILQFSTVGEATPAIK